MIKYKGNVKDQMIDYGYWLKYWWAVIKLSLKTHVKMIPAMLKYPWIYDHLKAIAFFKSHTFARTGAHLRVAHELYSTAMFYIAQLLEGLVNHEQTVVVIDEMIPPEILFAMGVRHYPIDSAAFLMGLVDQHALTKYIDATENLGVAADVCSLPSSQVGLAVLKEVPTNALCYLCTNLPCEGGNMSGAAMKRALNNIPTFELDVPDLYREPWAEEILAKTLNEMIAFLEKQTGETMNWNTLRQVCERYNRVTEVDLEKFEYARTDSPVITGATLWLPRIMHYQWAAGHPWFYKAHNKISKIMASAYERGEKAWRDIRYRTIVWNCPPQFYTQLYDWLERAWGISVLMDLETDTATNMIDTSSPETMLRGLAHRYMRSTMYRYTHGGYDVNVEGMFRVAAEYHADFIIMANQIGCRAMTALQGTFEEEARKRGKKICWFDHDLCDPRVFSRQEMRDRVNAFMFNVMQTQPLDQNLLQIDDANSW
ncbi:2-hydroxyacyl-CoA dehydratase family protein [candidate division CSSED10-310 bacterium]|uniref:2-hydroxyacyl-CoA dehydratase family protein n=1 Tax=candidate division CSSED10-310 bacterium TaxID=2855610 RepID=A0ABV6YUC1_UNCC1